MKNGATILLPAKVKKGEREKFGTPNVSYTQYDNDSFKNALKKAKNVSGYRPKRK